MIPLDKSKRYTARGSVTTGLAAAFSGEEPKLYDAFDCPECGCQIIMQPRLSATDVWETTLHAENVDLTALDEVSEEAVNDDNGL